MGLKMEYIAHRVNSIIELKELPQKYGVEVDLRDLPDGNIYISHEPFKDGDNFEEYLQHYHHGTMILNIKSERIEHTVIDLLKKYGVSKYFFLDSSFPMIKLLSDMGESNIAIRFSEYEGIDTVHNMAGKIKWVWVDTFNSLPLDRDVCAEIKRLGYKICLVSPELQGQPTKIVEYIKYIQKEKLIIDAVCSKSEHIDIWRSNYYI